MDCVRLRSMSYGGQVAKPVSGRAFAPTLWHAMTNCRFRMRQISTTGKSLKPVQPSRKKYFASAVGQISGFSPPVSPDKRGVRTSRNARWDAVDAMLAQDERRRSRTAKSRGSDAAMLASSCAEVSAWRRWQESPFTGESAK